MGWTNIFQYIRDEVLDHENKDNPHSGSASTNHGNDSHSETFAIDGDEQPPEDHGNESHTSDYVDDSGARSAVDGSDVSITGSAGSLSGDNVTTVNGETGDVTVDGGASDAEQRLIAHNTASYY